MTDFILEPDAIKILESYEIPYPKHALARNPEEAQRIAVGIGFPVVLKIVSSDIVHKSDVGGVLVNLTNTEEVYKGYKRIVENVKKHNPLVVIDGILVVKQAPQGIEIIIGTVNDPTFGITVMFGLGGILTEILKDVNFRVAPLEKRDAEEMIREIQGFPLLTGVRGTSSSDLVAIVDLLMSISRLSTEHAEIRELDLNPVRVYEKGLLVLDTRIGLKS
jgi:acyl-CoA synthetase (NDP forming)